MERGLTTSSRQWVSNNRALSSRFKSDRVPVKRNTSRGRRRGTGPGRDRPRRCSRSEKLCRGGTRLGRAGGVHIGGAFPRTGHRHSRSRARLSTSRAIQRSILRTVATLLVSVVYVYRRGSGGSAQRSDRLRANSVGDVEPASSLGPRAPSPAGFADAEFAQTAESFRSPDWTAITLNAYRARWLHGDHDRGRQGEAWDARYDALQSRLGEVEYLSTPTLMIQGLSDYCDAPQESEGLERFFTGRYCRVVLENVGHFPHREAPGLVADAVFDHFHQSIKPHSHRA